MSFNEGLIFCDERILKKSVRKAANSVTSDDLPLHNQILIRIPRNIRNDQRVPVQTALTQKVGLHRKAEGAFCKGDVRASSA